VRITKLGEYVDAIRGIVQGWILPDAGWYPAPWFRGHGDVKWRLDPSQVRVSRRHEGFGSDWYNESTLLAEFKYRAPFYLHSAVIPRDDWEWLFLMQHYGLPTRLLDWTESPLIALHFALRDNRGDSDACVWMLDPWWLNKQSLGEYDIPRPSDPRLSGWAPGNREPDGRLPVAIKPTQASPRITAQRGFFTIHGSERLGLHRIGEDAAKKKELHELLIPGEFVKSIRADLILAGISETTIFPELEGLCREMKDWFYGS
jgi:hypothetical protein